MDAQVNNPYLVVIAGGSGTRFWPKSTSANPKQLLSFAPGRPSLLAETLLRFDQMVPAGHKIIVTTEALREKILAEQLGAEILAEPQGRNTAPCIYWAARCVAEKNPKGVMMIMPADHAIAQPERLLNVLKKACKHAATHDDLITVAIRPTRPETGYGYLKVAANPQQEMTTVQAFVEKPNLERAKEFVQSGHYYWNAGMFVWRADVILKAFDEIMPEMKVAWDRAEGRVAQAYPHMTATSIDYGILEKAKNVTTIPVECGWDDLGSWTTLEELADSLGIRSGQNFLSAGEILAVESSGNIVDAPDTYVALLGIQDLIIVQTEQCLLVARKDRAQDLRQIVAETKKSRPDLV